MRAKGIGYDTGFTLDGVNRRPFDHDLVRRELEVIRDELHCTAVRIFGNELDRLDFAAEYAAHLGLEVWYSPFSMHLEPDQAYGFLVEAARRAERIRPRAPRLVFVAGGEISLFNRGFLPGATLEERVAKLAAPRSGMPGLPGRMNDFLGRVVATARTKFHGPITYASAPLEGIDWTPFDIVSVDAHRSAAVAHLYQQGVRTLVGLGKPVAITEFGCTPHRGASQDGARSGSILEYENGLPVRLDGDYRRDEQEQATYLRELLDIFQAEGVDAAFVCTFVCYGLPHRADPRIDLDMASWGVVKVLDNATYPPLPWKPKAAFDTVAEIYAR